MGITGTIGMLNDETKEFHGSVIYHSVSPLVLVRYLQHNYKWDLGLMLDDILAAPFWHEFQSDDMHPKKDQVHVADIRTRSQAARQRTLGLLDTRTSDSGPAKGVLGGDCNWWLYEGHLFTTRDVKDADLVFIGSKIEGDKGEFVMVEECRIPVRLAGDLNNAQFHDWARESTTAKRTMPHPAPLEWMLTSSASFSRSEYNV